MEGGANSQSRVSQEVQGSEGSHGWGGGHFGKVFPVGSYADLRFTDASGVAMEQGVEKPDGGTERSCLVWRVKRRKGAQHGKAGGAGSTRLRRASGSRRHTDGRVFGGE